MKIITEHPSSFDRCCTGYGSGRSSDTISSTVCLHSSTIRLTREYLQLSACGLWVGLVFSTAVKKPTRQVSDPELHSILQARSKRTRDEIQLRTKVHKPRKRKKIMQMQKKYTWLLKIGFFLV
ncbi:hypothetical protein L1987_85925 [Smallanthus sonchifolius]|uniref:Uncharacterized protein n=1 Tax=Smallanthus sonchifolius TaxID=185202 RepID=A0ACB8XYB8_9ASTR|nr:hypothetical protein L1987_85925 [Smallanthus sonchifolius]